MTIVTFVLVTTYTSTSHRVQLSCTQIATIVLGVTGETDGHAAD